MILPVKNNQGDDLYLVSVVKAKRVVNTEDYDDAEMVAGVYTNSAIDLLGAVVSGLSPYITQNTTVEVGS